MDSTARPSSRDEFDSLIRGFGEGWSKGNAEAIAAVFLPEGVFQPDAFAEPLTGQRAIREYWKDIPFEQSEISFRYGELFTVGPWFAVEFRCTFRRRRTGEPVDARGAIFCETKDGKIAEMRMYWNRVTGARAR
jgi:ketosteroid isomerase-like protein